MPSNYTAIETLLRRVRARWQKLRVFRASARAALAGSAVLAVALIAARLAGRSPVALALVALAAIAGLVDVAVWGAVPLRPKPDERPLARFIEERAPSLDDRLVSAVDVRGSGRERAQADIV